MIPRLHRSNSAAHLESQRTLTDALAHREVLDLRLTMQRNAIEAASISQFRSTHSELRWVSNLPVSELQAQIQQANWQYDLLD